MAELLGAGIMIQAGLMLLGALMARAAVTTARTPQGAVAWVVFLVSFPLLALPAYVLFGGIRRIQDRAGGPEPQRGGAAGERRLSTLSAVAGVPLVGGNRAALLVDGEATFDAVFSAISGAREEVLVQFYILRSDALGEELKRHLLDAAARGCTVKVLCDVVGSLFLAPAYRRALRAGGVELRGMFGPRPTWLRVGLNFRNHRKAIITDGHTGFTGGINAGQEYVDGGGEFAGWRDTFVRFEGPMVAQLRALYAADWEAVTGTPLPPSAATPEPVEGGARGLVTGFGPTDPMEKGSLLLCGLAGLAQRRLWITTPYFVPHTDLLTALQLAALRGVDLRIIVPTARDHLLPWLASRDFFDEIVDAGGQVLEYEPDVFLHSKVMLIDDDISVIGTINLDIRSALLNFEQAAIFEDRGMAAAVEAMLEDDIARSTTSPRRPRNFWVRNLSPVARLAGPLL
jgi:cardiolipin synthase